MEIFPLQTGMEWNNTKTPAFDVVVQKSGSKRRKTMSTHAYPEWTLECSFTALDKEQIDKLAGFFCVVHGQLKSFLWLDMEDYHEENVRIGTGNGGTTEFQLLRNWGGYFVEPITNPVSGTLTVFVNDVETDVTLLTDGWVQFATPPEYGAVITATFDYYWKVAFADDVTWQIIWYNLYKLNSFKLVSVR